METESKRFNTPTKPTPEQANPRTYISKEEYRELKTSYADKYHTETANTPGTRFTPAREPWFLSWQEPEEQAGKKSSPDGGNEDE